jgi:hypothetical protein
MRRINIRLSRLIVLLTALTAIYRATLREILESSSFIILYK